MSTHNPSRHVHRNAVDTDGNEYLVVCIVWNAEMCMSIRIWSVEGTAETNHWYFPKKAMSDYGSLGEFIKTNTGLTVADEDLEIRSKDWKRLGQLRELEEISSKTSKVDGGYVTRTVYKQPWFGWEISVVTGTCLSKQLVQDAAYQKFDKMFPAVHCALTDKEAEKAAKRLKW